MSKVNGKAEKTLRDLKVGDNLRRKKHVKWLFGCVEVVQAQGEERKKCDTKEPSE